MSHPFYTFRQYLKYRLRAVDAYRIHSPFIFRLYNEVIRQKDPARDRELRKWRNTFLQDHTLLDFEDPKSGTRQKRKVKDLVKQAASTHKFSAFLVRLIEWLEVKRVLETGTSTGVNASYLSRVRTLDTLVTIEGSPEIAAHAQKTFEAMGLDRITLITGNVYDVFEQALTQSRAELVFLDADHRSETIAFYMEKIASTHHPVRCIVIHDIHWSPGMSRAWNNLVKDPRYPLTIDLFQAGLIFPDYPMEKQHFIVDF